MRGLTLYDDVFARLPAKAQKARKLFGPTGRVDVKVRYGRPAGGPAS